MESLLPLLLLALAFVVLIVLPMRNRNRQLQATRQLQAGLTVGTEVMTTSGLFGRIVALADDAVELEVSPGVSVRWARAAIAEVRTPAPDQPAPDQPAVDLPAPDQPARSADPAPPARANGKADGEPGPA